ncbi:MAG: dihydrofolate reductase family protein [Bacteroidota bacterium]
MEEKKSKLTIHMVASLDGFISKENGDVSWLQSKDVYEGGIPLTDEYILEFLEGIDGYLMGSHTYEHALELGWPYGDKPVYVMTKRELDSTRDTVFFRKGDLQNVVEKELKSQFSRIWMAGGPRLTKELLQQKLADELVVSYMPIILGQGRLFFDYIGEEQQLHLKDVKAFKDGMVELTYDILT